jgi:hypothetical protein
MADIPAYEHNTTGISWLQLCEHDGYFQFTCCLHMLIIGS